MAGSGAGGRAANGALVAAVLAALAVTAACNRDPPRMTECLGNRPAAVRTRDVAPPNCDPVLPGTPQPAAAAPEGATAGANAGATAAAAG